MNLWNSTTTQSPDSIKEQKWKLEPMFNSVSLKHSVKTDYFITLALIPYDFDYNPIFRQSKA